jgi:regulator of nucleoside diphosphate kinase
MNRAQQPENPNLLALQARPGARMLDAQRNDWSEPMTAKMPSIVLSDKDVVRLERLSDSPEFRHDPTVTQLLAEISRARVVPASELPGDVVSMNSTVECVDERSGIARGLTLVYPHDADIGQGRVSVLSPVGMALLGLRVGQSIDWPAPSGSLRLTVAARGGRDSGIGTAEQVAREWEREESLLDEALRGTFPASDPIAITRRANGLDAGALRGGLRALA